jgi:hypothetical protein
VPFDPGVLDDVLGLGPGSEHAVGDALQAGAVVIEGEGRIVHIGIQTIEAPIL